MSGVFRGEWDCNKCDRKNISVVEDKCPSCGAVRDSNVTYHAPISSQREYVDGQEKVNAESGEDWLCSYCERLNHNWDEKCVCGASKNESEANYFELKRQQKQKEQEIKDREQKDEKERQQSELDNNYSHMSKHLSRLAIIIFIIGIVGCLIGILYPKSISLDVTKVAWEYTVNIDEEREFYKNDWNLPAGARLDTTKEEVKSYKDVPDGTEQVIKYRTVTVDDGYTTITKDLGNGYFKDEKIPKTKTVQESYVATETKYKKVPVMATKYYYYIDEYVYNRSVVTSGTDKKPYFGDLNLTDKERESGRSRVYTVTGKVKGKEVSYTISEDDWHKLDIGMTVNGKVSFSQFTLDKEG